MAFRFGFGDDDMDQVCENETKKQENEPSVPVLFAQEVLTQNETKVISLEVEVVEFHNFSILKRTPRDVEENSQSKLITLTNQSNSDLIPNVYEGGFKTWECAIDLVQYLSQNVDLQNKKVIELGCGSALPGIFALMKNARVDFQDYNQEVIWDITIPNVIMNYLQSKERKIKNGSRIEISYATMNELKSSRFFSGDWQTLKEAIGLKEGGNVEKYDIILTSETIYNPNSYEKLIDLFCEILNPNGEIYLAAKNYYFGVGGGVFQFTEALNHRGIFDVKNVFIIDQNVRREILQITFKKT